MDCLKFELQTLWDSLCFCFALATYVFALVSDDDDKYKVLEKCLLSFLKIQFGYGPTNTNNQNRPHYSKSKLNPILPLRQHQLLNHRLNLHSELLLFRGVADGGG